MNENLPEESLAIEFLSKIESEIFEQGLTQEAFASKMGYSPSYVSQVFNYKRLPNLTFLAKSQKVLNIRFDIKHTRHETMDN